MPIDASIISRLQTPVLTAPDPLEQYGKTLTLQHLMQQGQLGQQALADDKATRDAYQQSGGDPKTLRALLAGSGQYKAVQAFDKLQGEREVQQSTINKNTAQTASANEDAFKKRSDAARDHLPSVADQQGAAQWVQAVYQDPVLGPVWSKMGKAEDLIAKIPQDPAAFNTWKQQMALGVKFIEQNKPHISTQNLGGTSRIVSTPGLGGAPTVLDTQQMTLSPEGVQTGEHQRITAAESARHNRSTEGIAGANLGIARDRLAFDRAQPRGQYDAERGVLVDPRTGVATPVTQDGQPLGPKPQKPTEAYLKSQTGVANVRNAIEDYKEALNSFKLGNLASPDARAKMGTSYNNMMLQAKEAYNLGVLNGPDYMILQEVVTNPLTMKGGITSNAAMREQATHLDKIMEKISATSAAVHGQPAPPGRPAASAPPPAAPKTFSAMPDPAQYNGRKIRADDGTIYQSDGATWKRAGG